MSGFTNALYAIMDRNWSSGGGVQHGSECVTLKITGYAARAAAAAERDNLKHPQVLKYACVIEGHWMEWFENFCD